MDPDCKCVTGNQKCVTANQKTEVRGRKPEVRNRKAETHHPAWPQANVYAPKGAATTATDGQCDGSRSGSKWVKRHPKDPLIAAHLTKKGDKLRRAGWPHKEGQKA